MRSVELARFDDQLYSLRAPVASHDAPPLSLVPAPPPGSSDALTLIGSRKADRLVGSAGADILNGGLGNDTLSGGDGRDVFVFGVKPGRGNIDRILDFNSTDDTIHLSRTAFGRLAKGPLKSDAFHIGAKAHDRSDRIIYDAKKGTLSYDADGSAKAHEAVSFATLKAKSLLTAADFWVI